MSVVWRYLAEDGAACGLSRRFDGRDEAEAWLGESWPKLVESGIVAVELVEDEEARYRMSLREE